MQEYVHFWVATTGILIAIVPANQQLVNVIGDLAGITASGK